TYVLNANGTPVSGFNIGGTVDLGSPAIGPVSNTSGNGVWVANFGNVLGYDRNGQLQDQAATPGTVYAAPTIADLGSGPELLVTSSSADFKTWYLSAYSVPNPGSGGNVSRSWP